MKVHSIEWLDDGVDKARVTVRSGFFRREYKQAFFRRRYSAWEFCEDTSATVPSRVWRRLEAARNAEVARRHAQLDRALWRPVAELPEARVLT